MRGARQAGVRLRGKDNEVGIAELHAVAAARLAGWSAWVASRNSMDESFQDEGAGEVGSPVHYQVKVSPSVISVEEYTCGMRLHVHMSGLRLHAERSTSAYGVRYPPRPHGPEHCVQAEDKGFKPMTAGFRLEGIQGSMVAHVGHTCESGRHCALVVLACSEAFPEGLLDGAVFHWAVASREGGTWSPPPDGWQDDPSCTSAAGRILWQRACLTL